MPLPIAVSAFLAVFGVTAAAAVPHPGEPALAVFPKSASEASVMRSIAASGAHIVGTTRLPWAVMVSFDGPEHSRTLRERGALFVVHPRVAEWCL